MDPVSHVVFGRALIALDRRRRLGPHAVAACLLGAIAPDVDLAVAPFGWDLYLRVHQAGTHSILGGVAMSVATAAIVRVLTGGARYASLLLAACIGILSHLAFDVCSGGAVNLGWPLLDVRPSLPLVAMADPWLLAICTAGVIALWMRRHNMVSTATTVVLVIVAFLTIKGALMAIALPRWTAARGSDAIVGHAVEAGWGSLTEWNVFDRTPYDLRKWRVNAFDETATLLFSLPVKPEPPIVATSRSLDTVRNFLSAHSLDFAVVEAMPDGSARVLWSDIRYCWPATNTEHAQVNTRLACALWFGGIFDRDRRPVTQIVLVGDWVQARPVEP
jgi:membrane-bound metal-dependent hydrolase YbcI (DUF457 family)